MNQTFHMPGSFPDPTSTVPDPPPIDERLVAFANRLDSEIIEEVEHIGSESQPDQSRYALTRCADCQTIHVPRRLICCVDGTWMGEDGAEGYLEGNASNVFRIWLAVKEGIVVDNTGKRWEQKKRYFKGIGTNLGLLPRLWGGATGNGYDRKLADVYQYCALNICPSQDELFLFGFSRGAWIVRAVAGLFHHMGTLKHDGENWNEHFNRCMEIYKLQRNQETAQLRKNEIFHFKNTSMRQSPRIKFIGLFDTVKALNDGNLYDTDQLENTDHVRHALALCEMRSDFQLERFKLPIGVRLSSERGSPRTCLEAWFMGSHSDLGGSCKEDGLSLCPLQWILSESKKYGLDLHFESQFMPLEIPDPLAITMPKGKGPYTISFKNKAQVDMWDLDEQFLVSGLHPMITTSTLRGLRGTKERIVFEEGTNNPETIIHPSVYYFDDMTPLGIVFINMLSCRSMIRERKKEIDLESKKLFWNEGYSRRVDTERSKTRVLVCGTLGIGKSSIINLILESTLAEESGRLTSIQHDIEHELTNTGPKTERNNFVFHDAPGFERGTEGPWDTVQRFLDRRREETTFEDQLHCIWYCIESTQRLTQGDIDFFKKIDFKNIMVIVIFTKCDVLRNDCLAEACDNYCDRHQDEPPFDNYTIPGKIYPVVMAEMNELFTRRKQDKETQIRDLLKGAYKCVFVSRRERESIEYLRTQTKSSMQSEVLLCIHDNAIKKYLEKALPEAIKCIIPYAKHAYDRVQKVDTIDGVSPVLDTFRSQAQQNLPSLYNFKIPQELIFKDFSAIFSDLYTNKQARKWYGDVILTNTDLLFSGVFLGFVGLAVGAATPIGAIAVGAFSGAGGTGFLTWARLVVKDRKISVMLQAVMMILLHERLFWLGIKNVESKEFLARAMVEVLKLRPSIERYLARRLNVLSADDWENIIKEVVSRYQKRILLV